MRKMLSILSDRLSKGEDIVMVSVLASSGSTPRGAGSRMLVGKEGRIIGTIGGGAVEYRSEKIAAEVLRSRKSGEHDFSLTKDDVQNLGMICGGAVNVFFKFIPGNDPEALEVCERAGKMFKKGEDIWLLSDLGDGGRFGLYSLETGFYGIDAPEWLLEKLTRRPVRTIKDGRDIYEEQINSSGRVFVFGCGHVGQELVPVLSRVGFRCVALDDRPEFANKALFPEAEEVILCDFQRIADYVTIGKEDYVCVMTRGHAFDTVVQAQVLKCGPYYLGVIGSAQKKAGVRKVLIEDYGFSEEAIDKIKSPIGLDILAETPAEIAISVAAEMIELRAKRNRM